ncbi:SDR family oxidoreductase [Acidicapsa ligni]|uniref:SDR family oxidoreductase n=1 Tax=Acidicapsa ligni TaxID=542300 RepID=UPI0021DFBFEC|nr:SDR family oxidoreductase [Acidicapsa ligni]
MSRTVLITGASSGIGKTTAQYFAQQGWNVIATMRNPDAGSELASNPNIFITRLDVEDAASITSAIEAGIARFGKIDALVNNAGFGLAGIFETTPREKVLQQFNVNVFGVMDTTRAILPHFRSNKSGVILNIGSGAGVFALPVLSLYCASKFALEGFSEALSYELASQNIQVKMIEPGGVLSTNFGKRSQLEAVQNSTIADYNEFATQAAALFAGLRANRHATELDVAEVIYLATTDGTDQLRYVATKDIEPLVKMRRETSEAEYMAFMRSQFQAKSN